MSKQRISGLVVIFLFGLVLTQVFDLSEAKRNWGKKPSSGSSSTGRQPSTSSNSGHVTKPSYSTNGGHSNYENSRLSYSNTNNAPKPAGSSAGQPAPIGWNVPNAQKGAPQGPPPAYSPSNTAGGAKTNLHEPAPAYAAPPSYGAATGNVHTPITATHNQGVQSSYPRQQYGGATYHQPGQLPAGATYYNNPSALPAGATYHQPGHLPAGATYYNSPPSNMYSQPTYHQPGMLPAGATYYNSPAALPAGATYYSQPPKSSGPGFGE